MRTIKRSLTLSCFALILVSGLAACGQTTLAPSGPGAGASSHQSAPSSGQSDPNCVRATGGQVLYRSVHLKHHPNFCTSN
jgi:hypothetical protein